VRHPATRRDLTQSGAIVCCRKVAVPAARALSQVNLNNRTNLGAGRIGSYVVFPALANTSDPNSP
jgi:hypothetical protein